jgi:hypothetical protein
MLQDVWHKIDIEVGFGELGPLIDWVDTNCSNNWNYEVLATAGRDAGVYRFNFRDDRDYVNFMLWKK